MLTYHELTQKDDKTWVEILLLQTLATLTTQEDFSEMVPEDVYAKMVEFAFPVPDTVFFFDNGSTMVGDKDGRQMARYQGPHSEAIARMAEDGIDLAEVDHVIGSPESPVAWVRPGETVTRASTT